MIGIKVPIMLIWLVAVILTLRKRLMKKIILSTLEVVSFSSPLFAASDAFKAGDWMVRARALYVMPQESSILSIGGAVKVDIDPLLIGVGVGYKF